MNPPDFGLQVQGQGQPGQGQGIPSTGGCGGGGSGSSSVSSITSSSAATTTSSGMGGIGGTGGIGPSQICPPAVDRDKIYMWISELGSPLTRESALLELSKKREVVLDLAPLLWYSFGTMAALFEEIVSIYPYINPPTLTHQQSNRVCNALALLQTVASHNETRSLFLQASIPLFLYPFLHTVSKTRPFEYLRLTSLGVIGALVKNDEQDVINFLLTTEIIPLCLRIMEAGNELSKTVATFILQKIQLDEAGLNYICQTYDRFSHVAMILGKMVLSLAKEPSGRLLKHVVRCYLRLSDNSRAREALRQCLPDQLKDSTFHRTLKDDKSTKHWLSTLLKNVESNTGGGTPSAGGAAGPDLVARNNNAGGSTGTAGAGGVGGGTTPMSMGMGMGMSMGGGNGAGGGTGSNSGTTTPASGI